MHDILSLNTQSSCPEEQKTDDQDKRFGQEEGPEGKFRVGMLRAGHLSCGEHGEKESAAKKEKNCSPIAEINNVGERDGWLNRHRERDGVYQRNQTDQ
jgi:hypothetical protein